MFAATSVKIFLNLTKEKQVNSINQLPPPPKKKNIVVPTDKAEPVKIQTTLALQNSFIQVALR